MSPSTTRTHDDVLDLTLDEATVPFEPEGVLGTENDGDTLTVYTVSGGGSALILSREALACGSLVIRENDLTTMLRTGLSYLFRDGVRTVRVRSDLDSVARTVDNLDDVPAYRYEDVLFSVGMER